MSNYVMCKDATIHIRYKDNTARDGRLNTSSVTITNNELENMIYIDNVELFTIKPIKVIFNPPATIVFWDDGDKTVVKTQLTTHEYGKETFDKEKGLAMCFVKKMMGNQGNYYNIFKEWC